MLSEKARSERDNFNRLRNLLGDGGLPGDIDAQIAAAFNVALAPFTTNTDPTWALKEQLCPDRMTLFRDYPGSHYIVDLEGDDGEASGQGPTRARAFIKALCDFMIYEIESADIDSAPRRRADHKYDADES